MQSALGMCVCAGCVKCGGNVQGIRSYRVLFQVHILFDKLFATFCQSCSKQRGEEGGQPTATCSQFAIRQAKVKAS